MNQQIMMLLFVCLFFGLTGLFSVFRPFFFSVFFFVFFFLPCFFLIKLSVLRTHLSTNAEVKIARPKKQRLRVCRQRGSLSYKRRKAIQKRTVSFYNNFRRFYEHIFSVDQKKAEAAFLPTK